MKRRALAVVFLFLGLFSAGLVFSMETAHADMCSPMNGPAGFLWPAIQSCQIYAPQLGGIPRVYTPPPPANVEYPVQVPQFVPLPPIPPGLLP